MYNTLENTASVYKEVKHASLVEDMAWFFGRSKAMATVRARLKALQNSRAPALLCGEGGVGKGALARLLHDVSGAQGVFITLDVAPLMPSCFEAELVKAIRQTAHHGHGGTLYLIGVESLPMAKQNQLAELCQERLPEREFLGPLPRVICACAEPVPALVAQGVFSGAFYQVLAPQTFELSPLRERPEDVEPAAQAFVNQYAGHQHQRKLNKSAFMLLQQQSWAQGNLNALKSTIQKAMGASQKHILGHEDFKELVPETNPETPTAQPPQLCLPQAAELCLSRYFESLKGMAPTPNLFERVIGEVEKPLIEHVLRYVRGNQLRAASVLGINRNTLRKKIRQWGIDAKNIGAR